MKSLNTVNPFKKKIIEIPPDGDLFIEVGASITKMKQKLLNQKDRYQDNKRLNEQVAKTRATEIMKSLPRENLPCSEYYKNCQK